MTFATLPRIALGTLALAIAATPALAQTKAKDEDKIKTFSLPTQPEQPKREVGKAAPLGVKAIGPRGEQIVDEKLEEAMEALTQLIEATDDEDPQKPEYLARLAELYWDKAETFFNKAYGNDLFQRIKAAQDSGDEAAIAAAQQAQQDLLKERLNWQEETVKAYKSIVENFPTFSNVDSVLYYLGFTLVQLDRQAEAYPYFTRIVREKPNSPFAPDALLNVGEYYFNGGQMAEADRVYTEVENFPQSNAYGLAIYKKGWCFYNMGEYEQSMNQFLKVIEFAKTDQAKATGYGTQLLREAQRDLVMVYSQVGSPDNAIAVFKQISPTNYMDLAIRLAEGYTTQGEYDKSTRLLKKIIAEYKDSKDQHRSIEFQRLNLENAYKVGVKAKVGEEARRLVGVIDKFRDEAPKAYFDGEMGKVDELLRVIATMYHKEVSVTNEAATMALVENLYHDYLRLFPNAPDRVTMLLNYALLLGEQGKHSEAAERFNAIVDMNPDPETSLKAAHEAVSSYYKMLGQKRQKTKTEENSDLEPKELPEFEAKLVQECDRYIKMATPDAPDVVEARFASAITLYEHNRFKEAIDGFKFIIETSPDHPNAPDAARLILSSLHLMRDIKGLNEAAETISKNSKLMTGEVPTIVTRIKEQADFNKCYEFEQAGRHAHAAECFLRYPKTFPNTPLKDRAIFNAASNYFKARLVEKSLEANTMLVNDMPNSPLAPRALYAIADTYRRVAVYSEAARFYEIFVKMLPNHDLTEEALRYATVFRTGLGEYDQAIKDLKQYIDLYPKSQYTPGVYQEIGNILQKQGKHPEAQKHFESYLSKYGKGGGFDLYIKAHLKVGQTLKAQGQKAQVAKVQAQKAAESLSWFKKTVQAYNTLTDDEKGKVTAAGLAAAAEARFEEGDAVLEEMRKVKLPQNKDKMAEAIQTKLKLMKSSRDLFSSVEVFGQPHWTIAAFSRQGAGLAELATSIENAPVPSGFTQDQKDFFQSGLMEKAQPTWNAAKEEFRRCVEMAQKLKWYNEFSTEAEEALMKLDSEFKSMPDIRPTPGSFTLNIGKPSLMAAKEGEDVPKWTEEGLAARLKAAAEAPDATAESIYNMGAVLEVQGDRAGARTWYRKAQEKDPKLANATARLGAIDLAEGRIDEATRQYDLALQLDPANATAHNYYAAKSFKERNFPEAINHARMALVADPDSMDAYLNLAATYFSMGLIDVGVLVGRNAISLDPRDGPNQNMLGLVFLKKDEVRQAVSLFGKAANDDPKLFDALMNYGAVTLSYKDFATAAEQFTKAVALRPDDVGALMSLATALRAQGQGEEAKKHLDKVLKLQPNNPDPHYNLCLLFQETLGQNEKALAECETFVRNVPATHPKQKEAVRRVEGIKLTIEAIKEMNAAPPAPDGGAPNP